MKQFYIFLLLLFFTQLATANKEEAYACPVVEQTLQVFCERSSATVAHLVAVDQGGGVVWFSAATSNTALAAETPLLHGSSYYAGAANGSCSSGRAVVTVEIADSPNAGSSLNLTFSSDDPPVDLFNLLGSNAYGPPDEGGVMLADFRSGTTVFDPSTDGAYSGTRRFRYSVSSQNEVCGDAFADFYIIINPQANSSHRLIHYGDTEEDAFYNQNNYTPASTDEGILFNIWGSAPLEVGGIYKIKVNGLVRYYYVNNVYSAPELSPVYTLAGDTEIRKFVVTDTTGIGRKVYSYPILSNENYVYSLSPQIPILDMNTLKYTDEVIENITYFDGLGRGKQAIAIRAGGDGEDVITPIKYDQFGRSAREFLPYARNTLAGEMHPEVVEAEGIYGTTLPYVNFYHTLKYDYTQNPYSEKEFETSPLNRVLKQAAPGDAWKLGGGHEIELAYQTNNQDEGRLFKVDFTNGDTASPVLTLAAEGFYGLGQLYKTVTRDENHNGTTKNHTTEELKDKQGRVVLKRTYADIGSQSQVPHDTYYIYDDYGNLTYVLPPKMEGNSAVLTNVLSNIDALGYQYKYDRRNRLIEKKIPGKGWEYIVYNNLDQPILTQDVLLRAESKWLYTKYDAFGRVTSTGIFTDPANNPTQTTMQAAVDSYYDGTSLPKLYEKKSGSTYTNRSFPTTGTEVLTENFYDDYNFDKESFVVPDFNQYGKEIRKDRTKGLGTGTKVKVLGTSNWITTVIGYDKKGRLIWTANENDFLQTEDISHTDLDFLGKLRAQTSIHTKAGQTITIEDLYSYDHMRRQLTHSQKINGAGISELIAKNKYDELGVLIRKNVGGKVSNEGNIPVPVATQFDELLHLEVRENGEIYKISGETIEYGKAKTSETFTGDGYVEFSPMSSEKIFNVGLTYVDSTNPENQYNYFAQVLRNYIRISEGGANLVYSMDYQVNVKPGDKLTIEREGSTILYKRNGETYYISNVPSYGELRGEASVRSMGPIMHYMKVVDLEENENPLQSIHYTYNIRGWLKKINEPANLGDDLFGFEVNYNDPKAGATGLFNGNISETHWNSQSQNNTNIHVSNQYRYSYDALNRITEALDNTGNYNLGSITYDKMGNILSLQRQGHLDANVTLFGNMDQLQYTYDVGNQLLAVEDHSTSLEGFKDGNKGSNDYSYDVNGNLTSDLNKGITSVLYNHLNMPSEIKFNNSNTQKINYTYSADGIKQRKELNNGGSITITDYAGNFVYENNLLKQFYQPEGYLEPKGSGWQYVYQYKDIWGNTRITYADDDNSGNVTSSEIRREQNYYPFGLEHKGYNSSSYGIKNNLKTYQGQEFTEDLGLNTHEWKYRMSDPSIGRFWQIDPLAEDYMYNSTYAFQENKLGMGIELEGLELYKFPSPIEQSVGSVGNTIKNSVNRSWQSLKNSAASVEQGISSSLNSINNFKQETGIILYGSKEGILGNSGFFDDANGGKADFKGDAQTVVELTTVYGPQLEGSIAEVAQLASDLIFAFDESSRANSEKGESPNSGKVIGIKTLRVDAYDKEGNRVNGNPRRINSEAKKDSANYMKQEDVSKVIISRDTIYEENN